MSAEENKAIVRRFLDELWNKQNLAIVDELVTPSYAGHDPRRTSPTAEATKQNSIRRASAFPDIRLTIEDQIAEGDKVVTRATASGTHEGEWQGISPTGKQVSWTLIFIHRLEGGKLVERWVETDQLGVLQQIGAVSAPRQGAS